MIRRRASFRSRKIGLAIVSSPRRMLSATDRTGTSMKCWWTMLMPRAIASAGPLIVTADCRRGGSRPRPGVASPYRMFIRVDLPAPFSPSRAWISPGRIVEVDPVVGDDARVALRDAAHLQRGRGHGLGHGGLRLLVTERDDAGHRMITAVKTTERRSCDRLSELCAWGGAEASCRSTVHLVGAHGSSDPSTKPCERRVDLRLDVRRDQRRVVVIRREADGRRRRRRVVGDRAGLEGAGRGALDDGRGPCP